MSRTTVQIRDPDIASPDDFVVERVDAVDSARAAVPAWRRVLGVLLYLLASYVAFTAALGLVLAPECIGVPAACSRVEDAMAVIVFMLWLVAAVVLIVVGWRGRLPGFRGSRTNAGTPAI